MMAALFFGFASPAARSQHAEATGAKRAFTVQDAIRMKRLADPDRGAAIFSPDGKQFAILLKQGNLVRNTNDFSLQVFDTRDALTNPKARLHVEMSSSSNRDAIKQVKWLADSRTILFLGEQPDRLPQVYSLDTITGHIRMRTVSRKPINGFDASQDGTEILYVTDHPRETEPEANGREVVNVREGNALSDFVRESCPTPSNWPQGQELYIQHGSTKPRRVATPEDYLPDDNVPLWMSPDGAHAVIRAVVRRIPETWSGYRDAYVQRLTRQRHPDGFPILWLAEYLLVDTREGSLTPLLDAPVVDYAPVVWSSDSHSVFLKGLFLPLNAEDPGEREERSKHVYDIEIQIRTGEFRKIERPEWPKSNEKHGPLDIALREDRNTPPKIYVTSGELGADRVFLDLNPWLASVALAHVDVVEWPTAGGGHRKGELFLPPDYVEGERYPLVIQTHGFAPERFLADGPFDSSAFSAQALAAHGIIVLQMDYSRSEANTTREGPQEMAAFEGAIDELDRRRFIDRERVGIIGFSRTVYHVAYALTHSKYQLKAASLVDGIDAGYLQYLAYGPGGNVHLNGGEPFGNGLTAWLENSPSFQLSKVESPVRLEARGCSQGILGSWEWFVVLNVLERPVELTYVPDAQHVAARPLAKELTERESVDWFCFWLGATMDHGTDTAERVGRWEALRKKRKASRALD
ncbi:MAG TPA: hypothetical protein VFI45_02825 [Candidatus Acidoferrum sp.]|nr:hypothetical protein [Candidatus Acidoferrum sp.]